MNPYSPFVRPFRYNPDGNWIEDFNGHRVFDIRGWGYLTGQGTDALGLKVEEAAKIQDSIGIHVATLMNSY